MNSATGPSRSWARLKAVFNDLAEFEREQRDDALAAMQSDDPNLARELRELFDEHEAEEPLEIERWLAPPDDVEMSVHVGRDVGPYRLVDELGRGGMGEVFLAERTDGHFTKRVALKIVRSALDDPQARSRFLAERQILARLEHPNIARLLDGGVTDEGAPYLVMEWVQGEPITEYCDRNRLAVPDRLELMIQVCEAVHAAHRQLVVHRDLKPSNILVDREGKVRLLDFGIAKLISSQEAEHEPLTRTGTYILTPEYASPEQVTGEPLGTGSDVYALGLLLYQLLTGKPGQPVDDLTPLAIHRAVCVESPERPSRAIQDDRAANLRGGLSAARLSRRLAGDLDTIVEMAIRKEPERRYLSTEDLAVDLKRHLACKPVTARKDTFVYIATRFANRHKAAVTATVGAFLALTLSLVVVVNSLATARTAETKALAEAESSRRLAQFMVGLFDASDPNVAHGEEITARSLLDRGAESIRSDLQARPELFAEMLAAIGRAYDQLGYPREAHGFLEEASELYASTGDMIGHARTAYMLSTTQLRLGDFERAIETARRAVETVEKAPDHNAAALAEGYSLLGETLFSARRPEEAKAFVEKAIAARRNMPDGDARFLAKDMDILGHTLIDLGQIDDGIPWLERSITLLEQAEVAPGDLANHITRLGLRQVVAGRLDEAEATFERSVALASEAAQDGRHPEVQDALLGRATLAEARQDFDAAAADLERALDESQAIWGEDHPKTAMVRLRLGKVLLAGERYQEAAEELRSGLDVMTQRAGGHRAHLDAFNLPLARALAGAGELSEARQLAETIAADPKSRHAEAARKLLDDIT